MYSSCKYGGRVIGYGWRVCVVNNEKKRAFKIKLLNIFALGD